jgi:hypothetical protein
MLSDGEQQFELLCKERVVIAQLKAEQRIGLYR